MKFKRINSNSAARNREKMFDAKIKQQNKEKVISHYISPESSTPVSASIATQLDTLKAAKELLGSIDPAIQKIWSDRRDVFYDLLFKFSEKAFDIGMKHDEIRKVVTNRIEKIGEWEGNSVGLDGEEWKIQQDISNLKSKEEVAKEEKEDQEIKKMKSGLQRRHQSQSPVNKVY